MIPWVNIFVCLEKIHGKNIGELDYSYYSLSVFLKHPSIKKYFIPDKFIFCLNVKPRDLNKKN